MVFIDDRPVVAETFTAGPAEQPEYLLGPDRRLHADPSGLVGHEGVRVILRLPDHEMAEMAAPDGG